LKKEHLPPLYEHLRNFRALYKQKEDQTIIGCKSLCDSTAIAAGAWCNKVFKSLPCQTGCLLAVYGLQQGCYWCCSDGAFYEKCMAPFADILGAMGNICDPAWD